MIFNHIPTKDAKTLEGHGAEYFAPLEALFSNIGNYSGLDFDTAVTTKMYGSGGIPSTVGASNYPVDKTGLLIVLGGVSQGASITVTQKYITYDGAIYERSKYNIDSYSWSEWKQIATTADLANYLPLYGGGTLIAPLEVILSLMAAESTNSYMQFKGKNGIIGHLGFAGADNPVFLNASNTAMYKFLHTGNMADYVLPVTGGTVGTLKARTSGLNPLIAENTGGNNCVTYYIGSDSILGSLGFNGSKRPAYAPPDMSTWYLLHHDGNSAKVQISSTAPSDTSALWVY